MAKCEYYAWEPSDDPFADDGAIWSHHIFLYNKERKRVCYFYLRGVSSLSNSPSVPTSLITRFKQAQHETSSNAGSRKRAEYWLGDRAHKGLEEYGESDELDDLVIDHPGELIDVEEEEWQAEREASMWSDGDDSDVESLKEREISRENTREKSLSPTKKSNVRTWSEGEGMLEKMEL